MFEELEGCWLWLDIANRHVLGCAVSIVRVSGGCKRLLFVTYQD